MEQGSPPFARHIRRQGRRAQGATYERKIQARLIAEFEPYYVDSPWFRFREVGEDRDRWCQPDGLLFQPQDRLITIVEIKLQHTPDAWWQTRQLYLPIVSHCFPSTLWTYNICEIVKWYDPATHFPWKFKLTPHLLLLEANTFGVHICKP